MEKSVQKMMTHHLKAWDSYNVSVTETHNASKLPTSHVTSRVKFYGCEYKNPSRV